MSATSHQQAVGRSIEVRGVVQGVGFRPHVARLAARHRIAGEVGNDELSVFIEAEGTAAELDAFVAALTAELPPLAVVLDVRVTERAVLGASGFRIVPSRHRAGARTLVPPDVAVCDDCLAELRDPGDRRYRHAFITCTNCGPRFTIITDLPYDRPATTMRDFPLCRACEAEYADPADRRHHAQPLSCHVCGPRLWWEPTAGPDADSVVLGDDEVLALAQGMLAAGRIVAVKGVGGFHLACDATSESAVRLLRERKRRPHKPLAVMAKDVGTARRVVEVSPAAEAALLQPSRPIVLLPRRDGSPLAATVAGNLDEIGVMLPYAPLHHLLFEPVPGREGPVAPALLVMTSGNLADEPLAFTNDDARARLARIADGFLMHDREIAVPCEDSVVTIQDEAGQAEVPVRRSRGYAPLPVALDHPVVSTGPTVLAVGAEVKNTFCLVREDLAFVSAHIGDMGSLESQVAFGRSVDQLVRLRDAETELVVADLHPGYATRRWAEDYCATLGRPLITVQHHHAHLAALLVDRYRVGTPVLGVTYDGTGYGCDRQIWGGEVLSMGEDLATFERAGHLAPLVLPGGEAAVRNPFRTALALLAAAGAGEDWTPEDVPPAEVALVRSQLASGTGCVTTTSAGRLFDGVAALLGVRQRVGYEAQAAVELEMLARRARRTTPVEMAVADGLVDWRPAVRDIVAGLARGADRGALAKGFHLALAAATAGLVVTEAEHRQVGMVGLTGGVFANRVLTAALRQHLTTAGLEVLTHRRVPCNDAGLALGQAAIGRAIAAREKGVR
ncbi:carbamoyltransferase HypF [Nocardioides humi]|uniref:Carbamoyltransferase n=1 Tax=Nocardioides humi TaxID=449461 RepID=A0ABN2A2K2_9ACTN|nr:carbamoyltransferase HypF [Nocardioides humi]